MMKKKLFVISSRVPYPLDKGDKLRLYHQLCHLKDHFEICLCSLNDTNIDEKAANELKAITDDLHIIKLSKWKIYFNSLLGLLGRKPIQVHYFYQSKVHRRVKKIIDDYKPDFIYCQLIRTAEYVKDFHDINKTIDYQDAFSKGVERRIENEKLLKSFYRSEHKRLLKYENVIYDYFEHHTIISEEDRNFIFHEKRQYINIIPNGIDTDFFTPDENEKKFDLLFVGNMSYAPNVDSVKYIVNEILPIVWKANPKVNLLIAGANPNAEVLKLSSEKVKVSGWLNDIRDAYSQAKIFIAPMRIGSGLQNKLLEAMSMQLPCITSSLANRPLKATHGTHAVICKNTEDYAHAVINLLVSEELSTQLAINGREFVKNQFSWESEVNKLAKIIAK